MQGTEILFLCDSFGGSNHLRDKIAFYRHWFFHDSRSAHKYSQFRPIPVDLTSDL